ncbi:topless-related protein 1-like [Coffea arabica]|uniref:Topless-related protein 1-like n=1 Tax=Coffea arabica TaxID=13443 RepID=A0ABM4URE9_COFAR
MSLSRDLLFLIRQFCKDENLHKTAHMLEQETSFYFDMNYFEELVLSGNWSEVEAYLSSFTTPDSNEYSIKMYFEIRKQKFLEALDRQDLALALDILLKDLKCFASSNEHLYKEMAWLLTMEDFRKHHSLSTYGDIISARRRVMDEVKALLEANPHFRRKIKLPNMETTRLRRLINQSLNWQHSQCGRSECVPQINSLLFDHKFVTSEAIKDSTNAFRIFSRMPVDKVVSQTNVPVQSQNLDVNCPEDLPGKVERFGSINGETELWDVRSEIDYNQNPKISVNRVLWSPDGSIFGVAYSKQIVQLYCYHATGNYIEKQLEIDAHLGGVHDLAFSSPYDQILVITCGEDKLIKVWDSMTGSKQYICEGHGAPVYSLCAHLKEDIHFVFSTSTNGEIKAWMFDNDNTGPRVALDAPGHSCMRMAYSADGKRLFSCGTNEDGDSYLVEWEDTEGFITQSYDGLSKSSAAIVQFSTCRNRFLVAGDEHLLKFWDMDNVNILVSLDADGGLPAKPYVCFNKEGTLLAVFADDSKIKILANDIGTQLLQTLPSGSVDSTGRPCRSSGKICRLLYTNAGNGILALAADGIHLFWKWPGNGYNNYGQATTNRPPCLWHPKTGSVMVNDLNNDPYQIVSPCFALSKNDSYLVSASGGMVSLFNIVNFEKVRRCLLPPPTATCMAFYPLDNNLVAIGMDDSTVLIYNVRDSELMNRLSGHLKRVSGLAFSNSLKVLVSAAVDSQIIVWDTIAWEKKKSISMQISVGWWLPSETSETVIQFHKDQLHFLAIHETQLAMYESRSLDRIRQWNTRDFCARISSGTFSCDNQLVFVVMRDGIVMILSALDLSPKFRIDPSAYLPPSSGHHVYPVVIAAHPQKSNQFACYAYICHVMLQTTSQTVQRHKQYDGQLLVGRGTWEEENALVLLAKNHTGQKEWRLRIQGFAKF